MEYILSICDVVATLSVSEKTKLVSYDVYYGQIDSKTTTAHIIYVSENFYATKSKIRGLSFVEEFFLIT